MPPRSKVELLPDAVLAELNERLVKGRFSGYVQLSQWLKDKGYEIGKSALGQYGKNFEEQLSALRLASEQAAAVVKAAPDEAGEMAEALTRLVQHKLFAILRDLDIDPKKINVASITRAVAELARASITQKKYAESVREKSKAAAATVEKIAKKGGLSKSAVAEIRSQILGIPKS